MIKYKLLKTKLTGNIFPQQVESQPFSLDNLKEKVRERYGALSAAVIDETFQVIAEQLANGNTVSIDNFGTFSLRLGMAKSDVKEYSDIRSQDIRINGVRFNAARLLRDGIGCQEIHLQQGDKVRRSITIEDRWHLLHDYLLEQQRHSPTLSSSIPVTVSTYRSLTGCTDYTARKELALFAKECRLREMRIGKTKCYIAQFG